MADKDSLIQYVAQQLGPEQLQQMVDQVEQELSQDQDVVGDGVQGIQELINQLSYVAENPESYKDVVTSAIQAGVIDQEDAPPEFDPAFVAIMILALEELKARMSTGRGFAKGGLATAAKQLAAKGRGGDTMLAHINPREAEVLRRMGGVGTVNPHTGLHEFKGGIFKSIGKVFKSVAKIAKKVAPIAISFIPGIGPVTAAALGATMGALDGGGLKGALVGGLGGYLGAGGGNLASTIGGKVTGSLGSIGQSLTNTIGNQALGSAILGGASSALMGGNPLTGAILGGATSYFTPQISAGLEKVGLGNYASGITSGANLAAQTGSNPLIGGALGGIGQAASNMFAPNTNLATINADVSPYDPYSSEVLANAGQRKLGGMQPIDASDAVNFMGMKTPAPTYSPNQTVGNYGFTVDAGDIANAGVKLPTTTGGAGAGSSGGSDAGLFGTGITGTQAAVGLTALSALGGLSVPEAQMAVANSALTDEQKAAMNRELTNYTAKWNANTLPQSGTPEYAELMNRIQQGIGVNFMNPTITTPQTAMAKGGALSNVAMLARGTGNGRSDTINAKLSDGEYVIDAETVALLGNGSTKAGASALDQMREQIRKQKGKSLAKGKFSPNAKSPLAYLKGGAK